MSAAIMDDLSLDRKMFGNTSEFIAIKEKDIKGISEKDHQGVRKSVDDDIEQDDTVCIKTEYESTVSKGVESLEESVEKDS